MKKLQFTRSNQNKILQVEQSVQGDSERQDKKTKKRTAGTREEGKTRSIPPHIKQAVIIAGRISKKSYSSIEYFSLAVCECKCK